MGWEGPSATLNTLRTQRPGLWSREEAVERIETLIDTVETEMMPVPVREVWVFGDLPLGLNPIDRLDIYLTKELLLGDEPGREQRFVESHGIEGVGRTVRADWAEEYPECLRAGSSGYAAPEQCLAAHLLGDDEPVHLEVCNAGFEHNVRQRLTGAVATERYEQILDPRGVCLWVEGERSETAFEKLRAGEFVFPTLPAALEMLGLDEDAAEVAAAELQQFREEQTGQTVRGDVI